jgi:hypothetical protein
MSRRSTATPPAAWSTRAVQEAASARPPEGLQASDVRHSARSRCSSARSNPQDHGGGS